MSIFTVRFLFVLSFFLFSPIAYAATLYIDPVSSEIHPGDAISVAVRLDTDEVECVNVVDGVISYPDNVVPVDIALGNSILPVWVESPKINIDNKVITFAGGIPNGYCGRIAGDPRLTNILFEIIFQTTGRLTDDNATEERSDISFKKETKVLLNDGFGNIAPLRTIGGSFLVNKQPRQEPINEWNTRVADDKIAPSKFSITLNKVKSVFGGNYFIVFNTTDKQSGLDHYEVIEEPLSEGYLFNWGGSNTPWKVAKSPYQLDDQSLNSTIRVKAVDKAGNEYIATLVPEKSMRGISKNTFATFTVFFMILFVIFVSGLAFWFYRRKIKIYKHTQEKVFEPTDYIDDQDHSNEQDEI